MTQTEAVLKHLENKKTITSIEAIRLYGATRLSGIIFNLKKKGYDIVSKTIYVNTRYGRKVHCAEYQLLGGIYNDKN